MKQTLWISRSDGTSCFTSRISVNVKEKYAWVYTCLYWKLTVLHSQTLQCSPPSQRSDGNTVLFCSMSPTTSQKSRTKPQAPRFTGSESLILRQRSGCSFSIANTSSAFALRTAAAKIIYTLGICKQNRPERGTFHFLLRLAEKYWFPDFNRYQFLNADPSFSRCGLYLMSP